MALETGHQDSINFLLILVLKTDKVQYKQINQLIKKGYDQVDFGKANNNAHRFLLLQPVRIG
jgi:hypothetical protein